ncbi:hypothetical protein [Pilimelia columellifera]|uniref:Uncharacterized protein n=1 Tax=Pilimelia columellifera subsp. columellifera TaxID=706583 RepID=A0ABN3NPI5_9ACTN
MTADLKDKSGRVVGVTDAYNGMTTGLKHCNYHLSFAGSGSFPHPYNWTEVSGHFRSVLQKEAETADLLATNIEGWVKANPNHDAANLAAMKAAAKEYRAVAKSLLNNSRKLRRAGSCLEVTAT